MDDKKTDWQVSLSGKVRKAKEQLPFDIAIILDTLVHEPKLYGPELHNWSHYGKIKGRAKNVDMRHCQLNKGRTVYVAVWVVDDANHKTEVRYVGTHENADYRRIS
jgi:hypothetical protein